MKLTLPTYAKGTAVSSEKTQAQISTLLAQHGATNRGFAQLDSEHTALIAFTLSGARYRIAVPLPKLAHIAVVLGIEDGQGTPLVGHPRVIRAHAQQTRERWRVVLLALKAKLHLVALGVRTVEQEFLSDMLLPSGRTAGEQIGALIRQGLSDASPRRLEAGR